MIEASGEEDDSDEEKETTEPPAECPAHKATKKTKGILTDDEVVENSMLFLFAGKDTTAIAISCAFYELAINPDIQEKLQSEIDAYFEDKPVSKDIFDWFYLQVLVVININLFIAGIKSLHSSS